MNRVSPWIPAMFCGVLSLIAVATSFVAPAPDATLPVLIGFLPMCFVFVGVFMANMQREIRELRARLSEQQGVKP